MGSIPHRFYGGVVDESAIALVHVGVVVLGDVVVVGLADGLNELVLLIDSRFPVSAQFTIALPEGVERVTRRFERRVADREKVFSRDAADVHARPTEREAGVHYCGQEVTLASLVIAAKAPVPNWGSRGRRSSGPPHWVLVLHVSITN